MSLRDLVNFFFQNNIQEFNIEFDRESLMYFITFTYKNTIGGVVSDTLLKAKEEITEILEFINETN